MLQVAWKGMGRSFCVALAASILVASAAACGKGAAQSTGSGAAGPGGAGGATTSATSGTTGSTTASTSSSGTGTSTSTGTTSATSTSTSTSTSTTTTSSTTSSTSSSSGTCTLPGPAGKPYYGIVELGHTTSATGTVEYSLVGDFTAAPATAPPACAGTQMGDCCYTPPGNTPPPMQQSAGKLTVKDGTTTIDTLTAPPYLADNATTATLTWTPGSTLKVSAAGSTVDAFNLSVVAPAKLAGVMPAFTATPITVKKSADLVVSWTPSSEACSQVAFTVGQTPVTLPYIGCVVDDAAGTLTVPKQLLSMFTATTGTATITRAEGAGKTVANANVRMVATDGHLANVTFTP